ncbi:hypothetical protein WHT83_25045 (plasmid) [Aminobacter sp. P9b]|uniref:Uncharacterized protein n=1 Tax=Aminobacter niigataensis TaxID=83265 RepID=A0ABR6L672_9HYPH|nr:MULTISPECIES: hypothetical protein [Aminobacter]MBB4652301.1 hypothetical protein [Aminobacter niigataensis]
MEETSARLASGAARPPILDWTAGEWHQSKFISSLKFLARKALTPPLALAIATT